MLRIKRMRMVSVPFIHSIIHCRLGRVSIWLEPRRMFVGNGRQNGATDYDEEVTFYHHLEGRIGCNTVNPSLSTGKDYPLPDTP